jgi:hypothetical protein
MCYNFFASRVLGRIIHHLPRHGHLIAAKGEKHLEERSIASEGALPLTPIPLFELSWVHPVQKCATAKSKSNSKAD